MGIEAQVRSVLRNTAMLLPAWVTPMYLTYLRLALIPCITIALVSAYFWLATFLFIIAILADAFDGELARMRNQITTIGTLLDPIADKALIATVTVLLILPLFGWPFVVLLLLPEIAIAIAAYMRDRRVGRHMGATYVGKLKMTVQSMALVVAFLAAGTGSEAVAEIALLLLLAAIVLSIATLDSYIRFRGQKDIPAK